MTGDLEHTVTALLSGAARPGSKELDELCARVTPALTVWARLQLARGLERRLEPDELVQETWMRAIRALPSFDPSKGPFRAWLIGIGRNVLLEALRALTRQGAVLDAQHSEFALAACPDSVTSITRAAARSEVLRQFAAELSALNEPDRVLVACCGLEELGPEEAARRLGISATAAAKRWQRLRKQLGERPQLLALFEG